MTRLLEYTSAGLYCARGDFYIDPQRVVPRAIITHGHSDEDVLIRYSFEQLAALMGVSRPTGRAGIAQNRR